MLEKIWGRLSNYKWYNQSLQKKYNLYFRLTLGLCVLILLCLFTFPQGIKLLNIAFICIGGYTYWVSYRTMQSDRQLKKEAWLKQQAQKQSEQSAKKV